MARLARVVVPGVAHHVTQRGNRRQQTFFQEDNYAAYLALLGEGCDRCGFALAERYLLRAARYVERNPVRAKLCPVPWRWRWSRAAAHLAGREDGLVRTAPLLERVKDWRAYLLEPLEAHEEQRWRQHERTGRPLGEAAFLDRIERLLGRCVRPAQRGPKPKQGEN